MKHFKLGVIVESFRLSMQEGLGAAKKLGADGVQIYSWSLGALVDKTTRRDFRKFCDKLGLDISAVVGDLGGHGLGLPAEIPLRVAGVKKVIDLAADLGVKVVTSHIGVVPGDPKSKNYALAVKGGRAIAQYAAKRKVTLAVETGPEKAVVLQRFLIDINTRGIGVNLDPANLFMVAADDPVQAVHTLRDFIVHTHAKDGIQLNPCDPAKVYESFATGGFAKLIEKTGEIFREVPLGKGGVKWPAYLKALRDIGYKGYLTIEREVGAKPAEDIKMAASFLKSKAAGLGR